MTVPVISICDVEKSFGSFQAIHDISLDIQTGEFFSLLGPSGCGKTTLLRMLAGFESPSSGDILIDGQSMLGVPPHMRPVNMVFQNYAIFPHLSVRDNIAYGLRKAKISQPKRYEMVEEMLELVKLPGYGERRANQLSGGQRQRIALARALIMQPKVLLLDEPLGALDKQLREQMQLELRRLQRTVGITFVFVTHDQEEALTLSDRIAVMSEGNVLQVDTPGGLYETPKSRQVASFIGTMNFLSGSVTSRVNGHAHLDVAGLGKLTLDSTAVPASMGENVCLAVRPEKLSLSVQNPDCAERAIKGKVEATAYLGERSHVHVRVDGLDAPIAVSTQNSAMGGTANPKEGEPVWLSWQDDALLVLEHP